MSSVTDIILITSKLDDGDTIGDLSSYLEKNHNTSFKQVDDFAGGNKVFQAYVFMTAINYLDSDEFLELFYSTSFEYPQYVQLLLKGEHDDGFTLYNRVNNYENHH